jgi:tRNA (guanine-N7-)-methyltransferase
MDKKNTSHSGPSMESSALHHPHIRSFGAARSSTFRPAQKLAWENYYSLYGLGMGDLHPWSLAGDKPKIVEIGCGMGDATIEIAQKQTQNEYLAIDVYKPGLANILQACHDFSLNNIKVLEGDAMLALQEFEAGTISGFHVFFPDPWPKDRHHKRRLMRDQVITQMISCLKTGGFIYFVTDWLPYAEDVLEKLSTFPALKNVHESGDGFAHSVPERPTTRFEKKGLEKGHPIKELYFKKI